MIRNTWKSILRFVTWLGPARARALFTLLALTGLGSLVLNAVGTPTPAAPPNPPVMVRPDWVAPVQTGLALAFLIGAVIILISRFTGIERRQFAILLGPAVGALSIGILFPVVFLPALVAAAAWLIIAPLTSRSRIRREYQDAIKAMRSQNYEAAVEVMNRLIKEEPKQADHYRFRAEIYRLSGQVKRARADYEKVVALTPESGVGYNGLAEVYLQAGEYDHALDYGRQALQLEPNQWVPAYNLGMIEDRMGLWANAIEHLRLSLSSGIPDSRHRLLAHLWIARAEVGQGRMDGAKKALAAMRKERTGLNEWKTIFEAKEAAVLRDVLSADVQTAARLIESEGSESELKTLLSPEAVTRKDKAQ